MTPDGTYADDKDQLRCVRCKTGAVLRTDGYARCACGSVELP